MQDAPKESDIKHPLAEVFGYSTNDFSTEAKRYRTKRLCPFNNKVPNCTKDKAQDPLGVCSVFDGCEAAITCPIRFRQNWLIADDAADFFFEPEAAWTTLTEVRLKDADGRSAANINMVLCAYDKTGKVYDFGILEVEGDWTEDENDPPNSLSYPHKRLAPQLVFKDGIIDGWGKKTAVALNSSSFNAIPKLQEVPKTKAEIAWLIYDLKPPHTVGAQFEIFQVRTVFSKRPDAPFGRKLAKSEGLEKFIRELEAGLDQLAL